MDYLITGGLDLGQTTGVSLLNGLGLSSSVEFVVATQGLSLTKQGLSLTNPDLGKVQIDSGATLLGVINFDTSENKIFKFIGKNLGIDTIAAFVNFDVIEGMYLYGQLDTAITLIHLGHFSITETQVTVEVSLGMELEPAFGVTNTFRLTGYDPTQTGEPDLFLAGGLKFEPESITFFASVIADSWKNPFGLVGAQIRNLTVQVGLTYAATGIDNVGFIADLKWQSYDLAMAVVFDINDPESVAFTLTINEEISVIQLMAQMQAMALGPAAALLVSLSGDLFDYIPFTIVSFDSNGDDIADPLVSFVPFRTYIGNTLLEQGMEINGKVKLFGTVGLLALHVNSTFTDMSGSLTIREISVKGFLVITGTTPDSDLTAGFEISATKQFINGDGKFNLFGLAISQAHFSISPTHVEITDTYFALAPGLIYLDIDYLNIDLTVPSAKGKAEITMFGHSLAGVDFNFSQKQVDFTALFDLGFVKIDGTFIWDNATDSLSVAGTLKINQVAIARAVVEYDNSTLLIAGILNVNIQNVGRVAVDVAAKLTSNDLTITLDAHLGAIGDVKISIDPRDFDPSHIASALYDEAVAGIGALPAYIESALTDGVTDIFHSGTHLFSSSEAGHAIDNAIDKIGSTIKNIFGGSKEHNKTYIDSKNISQDWEGNGGNDVGFGNGGDDYLLGWQANDILDGGSGDDLLRGHRDGDLLYGGDGNDTLSGGYDNDTMYGGLGDDLINGYEVGLVDGNDGNDGADEIHGGAGNDTIYAGNGADVVYGDGGDDIIYGCRGTIVDDYADKLYGGIEDDTYAIVDSLDIVTEYANEGTDTVNSSVTYTLRSNVENLTLTGTTAINGTGNTLGNILTGNSAANTLTGLGGNDIYYVDSGDTVVEASNSGTDTVNSSITYILPGNAENLTLTGTSAINGTGNTLSNILIGNTAANILDGSTGSDTLTGSLGKDIFKLTALSTDTITDFSVADDTIQLENSVFTKLTATGTLKTANFKIGTAANDANDYLVYNSGTGQLRYDADGNGSGAGTQIALLGTNLALSYEDFVVI
ncbi:MAG: calcium-binding protein [Methylococcaceae bacterium]